MAANESVLTAPCAGLVVEVPVRGQSVPESAPDHVLVRMQSSESGAIVSLPAPSAQSAPPCQRLVASVYVQVGDYVRAGEALIAVHPAPARVASRGSRLTTWRGLARIARS